MKILALIAGLLLFAAPVFALPTMTMLAPSNATVGDTISVQFQLSAYDTLHSAHAAIEFDLAVFDFVDATVSGAIPPYDSGAGWFEQVELIWTGTCQPSPGNLVGLIVSDSYNLPIVIGGCFDKEEEYDPVIEGTFVYATVRLVCTAEGSGCIKFSDCIYQSDIGTYEIEPQASPPCNLDYNPDVITNAVPGAATLVPALEVCHTVVVSDGGGGGSCRGCGVGKSSVGDRTWSAVKELYKGE